MDVDKKPEIFQIKIYFDFESFSKLGTSNRGTSKRYEAARSGDKKKYDELTKKNKKYRDMTQADLVRQAELRKMENSCKSWQQKRIEKKARKAAKKKAAN